MRGKIYNSPLFVMVNFNSCNMTKTVFGTEGSGRDGAGRCFLFARPSEVALLSQQAQDTSSASTTLLFIILHIKYQTEEKEV